LQKLYHSTRVWMVRFSHRFLKCIIPLQNPTLGVLIADRVTSYYGKQDSGPPKPRCEASSQRLHVIEVVKAVLRTIPSGHRAWPHRIYAFYLHGALRVVTVSFPDSCETNIDHKKSTAKKGASHQKEPCNPGSSIGSPIYRRCHMATETASRILWEYVALAEFRSCGTYVNISMETSDYEGIPLCKILYFVRGMGLPAE
jgi:hypothetical protein